MQNVIIPAINYDTANGRKMSIPVDPASLMYSHFAHVSGVAAPQGTQGVSITKLNLLDVLIGQLNQVRNGGTPLTTGGETPAGDIDALIENYRNQIRQLQAASAVMPYIASPSAQIGAVFSLVT